jgi:chromosome segregation ATPase
MISQPEITIVSSTLPLVISVAGVVLSLASNLIALAYGYGILNNRVRHLERAQEQEHERRNKIDDEVFGRLRQIETVTPRLEDAAARLEKITSNGLSAQMRETADRLTRLEQHCSDVHGGHGKPE